MSGPYDANKYRVRVLKVHDGDTFTGELDLGFRVKMVQTFRLEGINAPELTGETRDAGEKSHVRLLSILMMGKDVIVCSSKQEKYGRWLGVVYSDGVNVNETMVREGYAVEKVY